MPFNLATNTPPKKYKRRRMTYIAFEHADRMALEKEAAIRGVHVADLIREFTLKGLKDAQAS